MWPAFKRGMCVTANRAARSPSPANKVGTLCCLLCCRRRRSASAPGASIMGTSERALAKCGERCAEDCTEVWLEVCNEVCVVWYELSESMLPLYWHTSS